MTNWILRSWREQKVLLKRMFTTLSDEDLAFEEHNREEMIDRLRTKLGKSKEEMDKLMADLQMQ